MSSLGMIFPGQGSQKVGMLADAFERFPIVSETFSEASSALGYDLWELVSSGPSEQLGLTEFTQPAILTASIALYRSWKEAGGVSPTVAAGHSLGEYSALVASGVLTLSDAVDLVRQRGAAMQAAVPVGVGAMAVVLGLDDDVVSDTCASISDEESFVGGVNFNAPGQVVIAGHTASVEAAGTALQESGARRVMPLPVSAPFHTPLMQPAAEVMTDAFAKVTWSEPEFPVVSNVNGQIQATANDIKTLLVEQICAPVLWTKCMGTIKAQSCAKLLEVGPGNVLAGLAKRIDRSLSCVSIEAPNTLESKLTQA